MKNGKKVLALVIAAVMMISLLAGCAGKNNGDNGAGGSGDSNGTTTPDFVYVADYKSVDSSIQYFNSCTWHDGKIYMSAQVVTGTETYTDPSTGESWDNDVYEQTLFVMDEDGTNFQRLENYAAPQIPEGMEGSSNIQSICVDKDGNIWVVENTYTYYFDLPENFDATTDDQWNYYVEGENSYMIRKLDGTGSELSSVDTSQLKSSDTDYFYINSMVAGSDGNLYVTSGDNSVFVISSDGSLLFKLDTESWIQSIVELPDGSVAIFTDAYDETTSKDTYQFIPIDTTAKAWGEPIEAPYNAYSFYSGSAEYDVYYQNGDSFYGYKFDTLESTKLFSWIGVDVDSSNINCVAPLEDGRILCISQVWDNDATKNEIITLTKTDASSVPQKTIITYACMYIDYNIRSQIINFNKTNDTYRIEVKDYSEYNTDEDSSAGLTKLTTEILGGQIPDILSTNSLPIDQYAAKGYLEDLWQFIDGDTELGGRDALVTPLFDALSTDGKLYQVASGFSISTAIGASSVVGDKMGWTLDDLLAAYSKMPEGADVFEYYTTKDDALRACCYTMLTDLVNWDTGECKFDSDQFIGMLKFADMFPETYDWESQSDVAYESDYSRITSGKQMLSRVTIDDFATAQMYNQMFGGNATFVGYPTGSGNGSAFSVNSGLAMSSTCENKEGAWQFMRTMLTEDYQNSNVWNFPSNANVFNAKLKEAMTPTYYTDPETGKQVEQSQMSWGWDDVTIEIYAMTQEESDMVMNLINSTENLYVYDDNLYQIITEDVAAFFAGQKSAEDVAKLIQSRVSLYINEQR